MKKFIAILSIAAYFSLSNFCLVNAAITGKAHHPHFSETGYSSIGRHYHDSDGDHDATRSSSHHHKSSDSDPCCTKLQDDPALLPSAPSFIKSSLAAATLLVTLPTTQISAEPSIFIRKDHGPPGPSISQVFFSPRGSRSPPLPIGL